MAPHPATKGDAPAIRAGAPSGAERSNHDQLKAITHGQGPLLIVAGPGTGKTRTLTHRIAHLIQERDVPSTAMLAVTFTEKAAAEMRTRLTHLLGDETALPLTATFHALCWALLREEDPHQPWRIVDDDDRLFMLQRVLYQLERAGQPVEFKPRGLLNRIVAAKQLLKGPEDFFESVAPEAPASQFARAYRTYQSLLADQHLLDFEDLILQVVRRLETDRNYRHGCRQRFRHVFVDEYQDLNLAQYRLVRALVPSGGNLCVIGDPDQAIYGFRGSDVAYFNRFVDDYPEARVIHLTRNYRSTETILAASWQVIRQGEREASGLGVLGSRLYSHLQGTPHLAVVELPSEKAEAVAVGQTIEKAVGGAGFLAIDSGKVDGYAQDEYSFADFAVLYRTSAQADVIAEMFAQAGIPFQTASRRQTYSQTRVAAVLAFLRMASGSGSSGDLYRIAGGLEPPLEKEALLLFLAEMEDRGLALHQALNQADANPFNPLSKGKRLRMADALQHLKSRLDALRPLDLKSRIRALADLDRGSAGDGYPALAEEQGLAHLAALADACGGDQERFLAAAALAADTDVVQPRVEKVTLATMHAAKGLEFPVVFVVGCEDGLIPLLRDGDRRGVDIEEERRLFYVALTRARERLYLSWSRKRRVYGRRQARTLSPFVADIERGLLRHQAPRPSSLQQPLQVQLKLF
jgi:superfamily I DNA/RNA helicase